MESERLITRKHPSTRLLDGGHGRVEDCCAGLERLQKCRFLRNRNLLDALVLVVEFGVLGSHEQHGGVDQLPHCRILGT